MRNLGQFVAMSIIQGGSGFPFLAPPVYEYFVMGKCTDVTVENDDIPDHMVKYIVGKVRVYYIFFGKNQLFIYFVDR